MKKREIALLLTVAMTVGMCGCAKKEDDKSAAKEVTSEITEETKGAEQTKEEAAVEKPESISWWSHDGLNEADHVKEWDAKYEELTGIHLEHTQVSNNEYGELLEVAFASGTEPNVFDLSCDQKVSYFSSQGGIADLTDLVKKSGLYDKIDKSIWDAISVDGKIYGVPKGQASGIETYVRQDWLDELGMDAPTSYEEYIKMLRAFRDNIDECTIPLVAPGLNAAMNLPEFYWDAEVGFTNVDGQWVDGMLQDNFAGAMQRLQDAYAEGLIDTEVVTNTTSACRDKWYAGSTGVFSYWGGKWGDTLTVRLQENFPDAKVTGIGAIDESYYRYSPLSLYCIDGRLSEKEVEQVFYNFLDYINDGGEGQTLFYCGVEGVHYEKDANGNISYLEMVSTPGEKYQSIWGTPWLTVTDFANPEKMPQPSEIVVTTLATLEKTGKYYQVTPISASLNRITSDLQVIKEETIANIVMGKTTVEDGLASYRSQVEALGMQQVLDEMNAH